MLQLQSALLTKSKKAEVFLIMLEIQTKIIIRPFRLEDLDEVMAIEPTAFGTNHWSRQSFISELNKPEAVYFVAHCDDTKALIGYSGFWVIGQEAHITTLAVHSKYRRQRVGERLLVNNILVGRQCGAQWLTLEVRASNEPAQQLYSKYGFKTVNVRPHYYKDNLENAFILWSENITTPEFDSMLKMNIAVLEKKEQ
jgi:ribosomal-protein-alanine N-acetyltransferase